MNSRAMFIFAAISGFIFVGFGAFGAHVLQSRLAFDEMAWMQTGLEYQGFHTLAILALAVAMQHRACLWFYWSGVLLALGTVLFSGSLYVMALFYLNFFVYVTPVGGMFFLIGWVLMLIGALRLRKKAETHE